MKRLDASIGNTFGRRKLLQGTGAVAASLCIPACGLHGNNDTIESALAKLESEVGGRLGVCMMPLESGSAQGYRSEERFGMCSTFKLALAAIILREAQAGRLDLETRVHYTSDNMVFYAPVTEQHLDRGYMTTIELAEAAQKTSDNVAANLLLDLIGGPAGFTERLRAIGDTVTRLDRYEPEMNFVPAGEVRDTTTPLAMASTVRLILSDQVLSASNRVLLRRWMEDTRTGLDRLRGGFPSTWASGDKTGTGIAEGMPNKYNDIAVAWPNDGRPNFVVAAYYEADGTYDEMRPLDIEVLRRVGEIVASA